MMPTPRPQSPSASVFARALRVLALLLAILAVSLALRPSTAWSQTTLKPAAFDNIGIDEHLGADIPLDLTFIGENGEDVPLRSLFDGKRPVALVLAYYECPLLCSQVLNSLKNVIQQTDGVTPGTDYRVVTISINPRETSELARAKKANYLDGCDKVKNPDDWLFMTGRQPEIDKLAAAVGFKYYYDEKQKQYAHPAMVTVLTGNGRISNYLYGFVYDPMDMRLSIRMAAADKVAGIFERLGDQLPLDLPFTDENGATVTLGSICDGSQPVVLTLSSFDDPTKLDDFHKYLMALAADPKFKPGEDYQFVTVCLNPEQTQESVKARITALRSGAPRVTNDRPFRVVTASADTIAKLADAIGMSYVRDPERNEYAYREVLVVLTPTGQISRYMEDLQFRNNDYRFALIEAGKGRIGNVIDRFIQSCFHYDPQNKRYAIVAFRVMQVGGVATIIFIGLIMWFYWRIEVWRMRRRRRADASLKTA